MRTQDDLGKVTQLAMGMVTRFGMNERIGQVAFNMEVRGCCAVRGRARGSATVP